MAPNPRQPRHARAAIEFKPISVKMEGIPETLENALLRLLPGEGLIKVVDLEPKVVDLEPAGVYTGYRDAVAEFKAPEMLGARQYKVTMPVTMSQSRRCHVPGPAHLDIIFATEAEAKRFVEKAKELV